MDNNTAVELKNISLSYKIIKTKHLKKTVPNLFEKNSRNLSINNALDDVSFEIKKGETVGIVGGNGAGKSTLLRLIAGIYEQDSGELNIGVQSVSLLALGTGFQTELSGFENIYLNGLLLGFTKDKLDEKLNDIISFSGIEKSINNPVRTYSSGMRARLAFSIACHIEPELLLIDEILGVGDFDFREKSSNKIKELINDNRTVMLVSHNLPTVRELCPKSIWLDEGKVMMYGDSTEVHIAYNRSRM